MSKEHQQSTQGSSNLQPMGTLSMRDLKREAGEVVVLFGYQLMFDLNYLI